MDSTVITLTPALRARLATGYDPTLAPVSNWDLGVLQGKRASVHATTLRARPPQQKAAVVAAVRDQVWPLIGAGRVAAVIDRELPMSQAAQAHRAMAASDHIGKILLRPE